ncbi:L,D-transpeptidase family protein [Methyloversatilis sp. MC4-4]|uniref:L,D-transpeptidase family protein n=1 Tax=Methyloversatilis sp. MC4-4 TaxID=3132824 RepID=UPI003CF95C8D
MQPLAPEWGFSTASLGFTVTRRLVLTALILALALAVAAALLLRTEQGYAAASYAWLKLRGGYTVEERVRMHAGAVESRLRAKFEAVAVPYPPAHLAYVAFKDSAQLEVYARAHPSAEWRRVHTYPILGMSGDLGPKLRQGDMQVPEGIYRAEYLNANSRFHLSIRLNYPNEFDLAQARADGRTQPGSDIMIHGTAASIGCLAMGNQAAEDLFILAALTGKERVEIVVAPTDFRRQPVRAPEGSPAWLPVLYREIKAALNRFPGEA